MTRNGDFSDCGPGCAIFEEEARRAPAVVACYWIDAHADKFGHINAPLDVGHQFSRRLLAGFEMHVGCACSRIAARAARGVTRRSQAQLPRRGAITKLTSKDAYLAEGATPGRQPHAVQRARNAPTPRVTAASWCSTRQQG